MDRVNRREKIGGFAGFMATARKAATNVVHQVVDMIKYKRMKKNIVVDDRNYNVNEDIEENVRLLECGGYSSGLQLLRCDEILAGMKNAGVLANNLNITDYDAITGYDDTTIESSKHNNIVVSANVKGDNIHNTDHRRHFNNVISRVSNDKIKCDLDQVIVNNDIIDTNKAHKIKHDNDINYSVDKKIKMQCNNCKIRNTLIIEENTTQSKKRKHQEDSISIVQEKQCKLENKKYDIYNKFDTIEKNVSEVYSIDNKMKMQCNNCKIRNTLIIEENTTQSQKRKHLVRKCNTNNKKDDICNKFDAAEKSVQQPNICNECNINILNVNNKKQEQMKTQKRKYDDDISHKLIKNLRFKITILIY